MISIRFLIGNIMAKKNGMYQKEIWLGGGGGGGGGGGVQMGASDRR